jgi:hypothetical protein
LLNESRNVGNTVKHLSEMRSGRVLRRGVKNWDYERRDPDTRPSQVIFDKELPRLPITYKAVSAANQPFF